MTKPNYPQLWQVLPAAVLSFFLSLVTSSQAQESAPNNQKIQIYLQQLQDTTPDNDAAAMQKLGEIGPDAQDTALEIINFLDKKYSKEVRSEAAVALARIDPDPNLVLDGLIAALSDRDESVRQFAAIAVGRLGEPALDALSLAINDKKSANAAFAALEEMVRKISSNLDKYQQNFDANNYENTLFVLEKITEIWRKNADKFNPEQLQNARKLLAPIIPQIKKAEQDLESPKIEKQRRSINKQYNYLKSIGESPNVPEWVNKLFIGLSIYALFPLTWLLLLRLHPLALLWIMKVIKIGELTVPIPGGGGALVNLSLHNILMLDFFHYHPIVLDAWVNKYIEQARTGFEQEETVQKNQVIPPDVKIEMGGQTTDKLTIEQLHSTFAKTYSRLLIWGEAGVGKTSWACTIARWGMAPDKNQRICPHLMIPLLVEGKRLDGQDSLLEVILGELQGDILNLDIDENISPDFLLYLLRRKRILVIVDNFSEMSEEDQEKINPQAHDFPINALIVTSQQEEDLGNVVKTKVKLSRLNPNDRGENLN